MRIKLPSFRFLLTVLFSEKQDSDSSIYGQMRPMPPSEIEKKWPAPNFGTQAEEYKSYKQFSGQRT